MSTVVEAWTSSPVSRPTNDCRKGGRKAALPDSHSQNGSVDAGVRAVHELFFE